MSEYPTNAPTEPAAPEPETMEATRHIGRTLEQEGIFTDVLGTNLPVGDLSVGSVKPEQTGIDELDVRTFGEDRSYQAASESEDGARALNWDQGATPTPGGDEDERAQTWSARLDTVPEPLKTHLPGDTSSDPHTDLGPDNATTIAKR